MKKISEHEEITLQNNIFSKTDDFSKIFHLDDAKMQAMTISSDGTLWIGMAINSTNGGVIYRKNAYQSTFTEVMKTKNIVSHILEDRFRNLWISTKSSENKGEVFVKRWVEENFTKVEGISGSVLSLVVDKGDTIWASVKGENKQTIIFEKPNNEWKFKEFDKIHGTNCSLVAKDYNVWAGVNVDGWGKIYQKTTNSYQFKEIADLNSAVTDLKIDKDDTIWVGTDNAVFKKVNDNEFTKVSGVTDAVETIAIDSKSTVWVGSTFDSSKGYIYKKTVNDDAFIKISQEFEPVYQLAIDQDNTIWAGATKNYETIIYKFAQINDKFIETTSFKGGEIHALTSTANNVLLIGTAAGYSNTGKLYKMNRDSVISEILNTEYIVGQVVEDQADNLWLATRNIFHEGAVLVKYVRAEQFIKVEGISGAVWSLTVDDERTIWAGVEVQSDQSVIYKKSFNEATFTEFAKIPGIIMSLAAKDNNVWAGVTKDDIGKIYKKTERGTTFIQVAQLDGSIRDLKIDETGTIWAATFYSIFKKAVTDILFVKLSGLHASANSIAIDSHNTVWVGTSFGFSRGYMYKKTASGKAFVKIPQEFKPIYNIVVDKDDVLWVGSALNMETFIYKKES